MKWGSTRSFYFLIVIVDWIFILFQVPLSSKNWITVLSWALPILLVDEILKAFGRRLNQKTPLPIRKI
jgi:hypothetical protein